jgi:hypothetical protein
VYFNECLLLKKKSYEKRNVEVYFADARGDTYRDSNKPRSAELHDDDVTKNPLNA